MGVRVAYGKKGRISAAIASGTIPRDSLIITSDSKESELYFYDANGEMKNISERKQFETLTEAQAWVKTYDCAGHIISVHNGSDWVPYIVSADGKLSPVNTGDITMICTKPERNAATVFVGRTAPNVLRCTCSLEQHADDVYCLSENGFRVHMYISRFQNAARPALLMHRESKTVKSTRFIPRRYFYRCIVLR